VIYLRHNPCSLLLFEEPIHNRAEIERSRTEEIKEVFQDWIDRCVICKAEGREGQEAGSNKWMGCRVK
jgi:hypothetical protein